MGKMKGGQIVAECFEKLGIEGVTRGYPVRWDKLAYLKQ